MLTLIGPGGVGKTRLALALADEVTDAFTNGVVWVDLAPLTEPELVPAAVSTAIGLNATLGPSISDELASILRPRQTLLLLDNCEHLLVATAALVARLLSACPALQILATSRAPLRVRGEYELAVAPLPLPPADAAQDPEVLAENEAVALFLERARAVGIPLPLDKTTGAAVATICRALDGLPLAIELAAARVKHLSPQALLEQEQVRLWMLRSGARDLPDRQQTMRHTIAWSFDLLNPEDQAVFRRLGVFAGGFDIESAAAVASGGAGDILEPLEALADHSLVRRERCPDADPGDALRFGMLETIREFAREQLVASGEYEAVAACHAAYFVDLVQRVDLLWEAIADEWVARLESEHANLRTALGWLATNDPIQHIRLAGALGLFWHYRGHLSEGRRWLEGALAIAADLGDVLPAADHANALINAGIIFQMQGELAQAQASFEQGLRFAVAAEDVRRATIARSLLGSVLLNEAGYDEAEPLFVDALGQWWTLHNPIWTGVTLFHLGLVAFARRDWHRAAGLFTEAIQLQDANGGEIDAINPLHYLALIACERGEFGEAASLMAEVLQRLRRRGSELALADGLADVATLAALRGDFTASARLFGTVARLLEAAGKTFALPGRDTYERAQATARHRLTDEAWQTAFTSGRAMPFDRALAEAERMLTALAPDDPVSQPLPAAIEEVDGSTRQGAELVAVGAAGWLGEGLTVGADLTRREREVLVLLCQRLTDPEIAARLFISPRTASSHVANLLAKLGAVNRREAAALAVQYRLV